MSQTPGSATAEAPVAASQSPTGVEKPIGSLLGNDSDMIETQNAPVDTTGLRRAVLSVNASEGPGKAVDGAKHLAADALAAINDRLGSSPAFVERYGDLDGFIAVAISNELASFDAG